MNWVIQIFILVPLIGFILSLLIKDKNEGLLSKIAFLTAGTNFISFAIFIVFWFFHGHPVLNIKEVVLYQSPGYEFLLDFYFDKITAVYLMVGSMLTFLITIYSRYYLHRETGYKRFFNTIMFFYLGYNVAIFAGNFETLFIGWEILGISSFLLIAFYRDRYLPVRNAVKVFSIYRIGDIGLLFATWASHLLWHENITFLKLNNSVLVHEHLQNHSVIGVFISLMILLAAAAKSAQLPFSSWLPRAMEGPTPSSAIFYGSLSVHFGVFLLLRTFPFWEQQTIARILIAALGLSTAIIATFIARVQSSIKAQVAYASIAQIGLIFIEIAAGFQKVALIHFAGNAFLRTYQLLVSPSVVSYLIREQFYHFTHRAHSHENTLLKRIENSTYILSLKEWNLDKVMNRLIFYPFKALGHKLDFISMKNVLYYVLPVYVAGASILIFDQHLSRRVSDIIPYIFAFFGLVMVLKSFSERKSPHLALLLIVLNHFWIALAMSFNEKYSLLENIMYLGGIVVAGVVGFVCLNRLKKRESQYFDLNQYYGHVYEYPRLAFVFFVACLALTGFPITPTFIGEDLIFSHIHRHQYLLAAFLSLSYVVDGIALVRMFSRLFLGPHIKTYHETPYKAA